MENHHFSIGDPSSNGVFFFFHCHLSFPKCTLLGFFKLKNRFLPGKCRVFQGETQGRFPRRRSKKFMGLSSKRQIEASGLKKTAVFPEISRSFFNGWDAGSPKKVGSVAFFTLQKARTISGI